MRVNALLTAALIVAAIPVAAAKPHRSITVDARSEIRVTPDEAVIEFGVRTGDASVIDAKRENDRISVLIARAVKKLNLESEAFQVTDLEIQPRYEGRSPQRQTGYQVNRSFEIRTTQFSKVESAIEALIDVGGNAAAVRRLNFRVRDQRKHQTEARRLAMEYAREKAEHLATLNGMALGLPSKIHESVEESDDFDEGFSGFGGGGVTEIQSPQHVWQLVSQTKAGSTPADPVKPSAAEKQLLISPGQVSLNATVYVTYDLVPKK